MTTPTAQACRTNERDFISGTLLDQDGNGAALTQNDAILFSVYRIPGGLSIAFCEDPREKVKVSRGKSETKENTKVILFQKV